MDAEMGDSYWEETQRYLEYEELRYGMCDRLAGYPCNGVDGCWLAADRTAVVHGVALLQHLPGGAGGRHVLLRLQLAGRVQLPFLLGSGR